MEVRISRQESRDSGARGHRGLSPRSTEAEERAGWEARPCLELADKLIQPRACLPPEDTGQGKAGPGKGQVASPCPEHRAWGSSARCQISV